MLKYAIEKWFVKRKWKKLSIRREAKIFHLELALLNQMKMVISLLGSSKNVKFSQIKLKWEQITCPKIMIGNYIPSSSSFGILLWIYMEVF